MDPADLEVFRHRMASVAEAMGATLQRAASSPNIKERLDFSCAVFDGRGRLVAQAAHIPVHLGAMPAAVAAARAHGGEPHPGDILVLNAPYLGGSHLPDLTTVSPLCIPGDPSPRYYLATRAHHADVGGSAPGSLPSAADLFGEGLVLPPVHLIRAGRLVDDIVDVICANSRTPDERRGDLEAQVAAHLVGAERLAALHAGTPDGLDAAIEALLAYSARLTRAALRVVPDGVYPFEDWLDDNGHGLGPLRIAVRVDVLDGRIRADFEGTAPETGGGVNAPLAVARSAVCYVVACLAGDAPINAGMFDGVDVVAPAGCLLNPSRQAAVAGGNVETSQRVVDVVMGALAPALPSRIPAASQGTMNNVVVGGVDPRDGRAFAYYETIGGGAGAGAGGPGAHGIQVHMTNTRNTPVEALEIAYPIRVDAYRLRRASGGAGRHAGGDGVERRLRFLSPAHVSLLTERRTRAPWGLAGGRPGRRGENRLVPSGDTRETPLPNKGGFTVSEGDVLIVRTPGGGGWGPPVRAGGTASPGAT